MINPSNTDRLIRSPDFASRFSRRCVTQVHGPNDSDRERLKLFIQDRFNRAYGADINSFMPNLVSISNHAGEFKAAVGYRSARDERLFLEQYLSDSVESLLIEKTGQMITRDQIVEVGNLACASIGYARLSIIELTLLLYSAGYEWVVFTLTKELYNSFQRLQLQPQFLASADRQKISSGLDQWGSYYDSEPRVMFGHIETGLRTLLD